MPLLSTLPTAVPSVHNALLTGLPPWSPVNPQQSPRNKLMWAICSRGHGWNISQPQGLAPGAILEPVISSSLTHSPPLDLNDKYLPCPDSPMHLNTDLLQLPCQTALEDQSFTSLLGHRSSDADEEGMDGPLTLSGQQSTQDSPSNNLAGTQYPSGDRAIYPVVGNIIHCTPTNSTLPQTGPHDQIGMNRCNDNAVNFELTNAPLRNPVNNVDVPDVPFLLNPSEFMTAPTTNDDIVDSSLTQSQICAAGFVGDNFFVNTDSNPSDSVKQFSQSENVVQNEAVDRVDHTDCCENNETCSQGQYITNGDDKDDPHQFNDEFLEVMLCSPNTIEMESLSMFVKSTNGSTDQGAILNTIVPSMEKVNDVLGCGNDSLSEAKNREEESAELVILDNECDGCKPPRSFSTTTSPAKKKRNNTHNSGKASAGADGATKRPKKITSRMESVQMSPGAPSTPDNVMSEDVVSPTSVRLDQRKTDGETGPETQSDRKRVNKPRKISKREAAKAASELEHRRERAIALLAKTKQITDEELLRLKPKKKRRAAKFDKPIPSRFCHICSRTLKNVQLAVCSKIKEGICRKVICEKCFGDFKLGDFQLALETSTSEWTCPHCREECPIRAQCRTYQRINDRLRANRLKQEKPCGRKRGRKNEGADGSNEEREPKRVAFLLPAPGPRDLLNGAAMAPVNPVMLGAMDGMDGVSSGEHANGLNLNGVVEGGEVCEKMNEEGLITKAMAEELKEMMAMGDSMGDGLIGMNKKVGLRSEEETESGECKLSEAEEGCLGVISDECGANCKMGSVDGGSASTCEMVAVDGNEVDLEGFKWTGFGGGNFGLHEMMNFGEGFGLTDEEKYSEKARAEEERLGQVVSRVMNEID